MKSVKCSTIGIRVSPRKLSLVAGLIRNMNVASAIKQLKFCRKKVAADVMKCLYSGVANAGYVKNINVDSLVVSKVTVGKSIVLKRLVPRAKGRGTRINKFFSNLYIELTEE